LTGEVPRKQEKKGGTPFHPKSQPCRRRGKKVSTAPSEVAGHEPSAAKRKGVLPWKDDLEQDSISKNRRPRGLKAPRPTWVAGKWRKISESPNKNPTSQVTKGPPDHPLDQLKRNGKSGERTEYLAQTGTWAADKDRQFQGFYNRFPEGENHLRGMSWSLLQPTTREQKGGTRFQAGNRMWELVISEWIIKRKPAVQGKVSERRGLLFDRYWLTLKRGKREGAVTEKEQENT